MAQQAEVFYGALEKFLLSHGFEAAEAQGREVDGNSILHTISCLKSSPCGITGPCVSENVSGLLRQMNSVPRWDTKHARAALEAAGFCVDTYL